MATAAATMAVATHHPRARPRLRICAAWDMDPGAATVAVPKPSKAKAKPPATPTTPVRPPPPTHADLFARSSEGQGVKTSTYMGFEKWWLPPPPAVKKPRSLYSAASLAYLGDCIYELLGEDFLTEEER
nr:unnamed protein product [Digitaria exilis]